MAALVDRSLVQHTLNYEHDLPDRYRLLVSIRQFAAEQLEPTGSEDLLLHKHAGYYADRITPPPEWTMDDLDRTAAAMSDDLHNIRAALSWARDAEDAEDEPRLTRRVAEHLSDIGLGQEACAVADHALAHATPGTPQYVELLLERSGIETKAQRHEESRVWATRGVLAARELGDLSLLIVALAGGVPRSRVEARRVLAEIDELRVVLPDSGSFYPTWYVDYYRDSIMNTYVFADPVRIEAATRHILLTGPADYRPTFSGIFGWVLLVHGGFAEARELFAPFEQPQGSPGAGPWVQAGAAIDAANLRTFLGDFTAAAADLDLAERRL